MRSREFEQMYGWDSSHCEGQSRKYGKVRGQLCKFGAGPENVTVGWRGGSWSDRESRSIRIEVIMRTQYRLLKKDGDLSDGHSVEMCGAHCDLHWLYTWRAVCGLNVSGGKGA